MYVPCIYSNEMTQCMYRVLQQWDDTMYVPCITAVGWHNVCIVYYSSGMTSSWPGIPVSTGEWKTSLWLRNQSGFQIYLWKIRESLLWFSLLVSVLVYNYVPVSVATWLLVCLFVCLYHAMDQVCACSSVHSSPMYSLCLSVHAASRWYRGCRNSDHLCWNPAATKRSYIS